MQRSFTTRTIICLIPVLLSAFLVGRAYLRYEKDGSGFRLGTDLSGGTILVYEVDQELSKLHQEDGSGGDRAVADSKLAESIKRRIDPADQKNVTVRPLGGTRVEIILPTGGPATTSSGKQRVSSGEVEEIKRTIQEVGSLEFRILANTDDDAKAIDAAQDYFKNADNKKEIEESAKSGLPPRAPSRDADGNPFVVMDEPVSYEWVELGKHMRSERGLSSKMNEETKTEFFKILETTRLTANGTYQSSDNVGRDETSAGGVSTMLYYSRECVNEKDTKERDAKKFEYFVLTRISEKDRVRVGGDITVNATAGQDGRDFKPAVDFQFNTRGGQQFRLVTTRNKPTGEGVKTFRRLAILLDGKLISNPTLNAIIDARGQISGGFTKPDVDKMVKLLRSGALPATLKPLPVSENTIGATLGADTIKSGTRAVVIAFLAVLLFMIFYYRFAGLVATIALLANLLLTVGFMVAFDATFTLPGLAGLVLMLGMAVDANVLIYERVREERDRGMNIITALRNGYDRAFGTIIDTHLSSIFTAIVLYAVGNDQLKGFGVSLTVGLIISLFTSLYMTRLIFDFWQARNWLKQLRMMKMFSRPSIDFMKIRKAMFTATAIMTVVGLGLFLMRGQKSLNVDFVGGTAYGGQLKEPVEIGKLRQLLGEESQAKMLKVEKIEELPEPNGKPKTYVLTYEGGKQTTVSLANPLDDSSEEARKQAIKTRVSILPDWSVEQIFTLDSGGSASKFFTVRTTEKEPELVKASINRLMSEGDKPLQVESTMTVKKDADDWILSFSSPASKSQVKTLLEQQFQRALGDKSYVASDVFEVIEQGESVDGRYSTMKVKILKDANEGIKNILKANELAGIFDKAASEFASKPQPERLEVFDGTLASETRTRAFYAIVASWIAILLYLWFRFGNWTFGAAAVICLIHDLCFTLGMIAVCHYLHDNPFGKILGLQDFKIDLPAVAALLTLVGYSVNDTIVVFDRIREVRGKSPALNEKMINDSVNQTLSRTILASLTTFLVAIVLYIFGGEGVHLFAFVMVVGVIVGTYSSIYIASPLLLIFGEGKVRAVEGVTVQPAIQTV
jgi:SecD/SecF fusion protein